MLFLSVLTYRFIEQPCRNPKRVGTRQLLSVLGTGFVLLNVGALYVYLRAGVVRDIPELGISKSQVTRNMHAAYNSRILSYDHAFLHQDKTRVLVIGDSFARDWVNVLLESNFRDDLEISYVEHADVHPELKKRADEAQIIFYASRSGEGGNKPGLPLSKLWVIGTKNFGKSNGIFYNHRGRDYHEQRTQMEEGYFETNQAMRREWAQRYIDLIGKVIDSNREVPVFTPSQKFISQDCRHFTKAGAQYFAQALEIEIANILKGVGVP